MNYFSNIYHFSYCLISIPSFVDRWLICFKNSTEEIQEFGSQQEKKRKFHFVSSLIKVVAVHAACCVLIRF